MECLPYNLLIMDLSNHAVLLVSGISGEIIAELPLPADMTPSGMAVTDNEKTAYIPTAGNNGTGALFIVNLAQRSLYRLPLEIPHPMYFTLLPSSSVAYLVDPAGVMYALDTVKLSLTTIGSPDSGATCVGLTADHTKLYSAWEHRHGGTIAVFSHDGRLEEEYTLCGIPTNITVDSHGTMYVPFTATPFTGEGIAIFNPKNQNPEPAVVTIQCSMQKQGLRSYPCHICLSPDERTAYVVNEDSAAITVIDIASASITSHIPVKRSISCLYPLPEGTLAIASSNMFADLSIIDLVNERLLSFTDSGGREIASCMAILSPDSTPAPQ